MRKSLDGSVSGGGFGRYSGLFFRSPKVIEKPRGGWSSSRDDAVEDEGAPGR